MITTVDAAVKVVRTALAAFEVPQRCVDMASGFILGCLSAAPQSTPEQENPNNNAKQPDNGESAYNDLTGLLG